MPTSKELTIRMENKPGTLGKVCQALADQKVNILAFQSLPSDKESAVRMVVDNPDAARTALDTEHVRYTEAEVVQVRLPNRPGELARAASQLGGSNINIEYAYCGIDTSSTPLVIFGVKDAAKAATALEKVAIAA